MSRLVATATVLLITVSACIGQTKPAAAHQRDMAPAAKAPAKAATKSDAVVEATIRAKFAKSKIDADKFQVHVQGGVATIEGHTDIIQHKGVATRMAKTGGAVAVNNHIQISDAARKKASENLEKGRRRVQVTRGEPRSNATPPRQGH